MGREDNRWSHRAMGSTAALGVPRCFIDVEVDGAVVRLLARRAPDRALDHGISDLRYEYHVLQVLEAHGIPVPHIYGFCDEPEGLLLARLPGRTEMVDAANDDERVALLDEYVEIMARMHAIPVADFEARGLRRPTTSDELGLADFDSWERVYRGNAALRRWRSSASVGSVATCHRGARRFAS